MQEATLILRAILRTLDLELPPDSPVWPVHRITLQPAGGLWMLAKDKCRAAPRVAQPKLAEAIDHG
jgi:hypothetical protein